jgi:protein tyrosine phosphatase (PTP) superfamily phosphohydrolase (DUF442 family)
MKQRWIPIGASLAVVLGGAAKAEFQDSAHGLSSRLERPAKVQAPVVLCIDDKPGPGGQPSGQAYARAAANGFRSILTLRSSADRVDLVRERLIVERNKMRYHNIPVAGHPPRREQVDEFLRLARDRANQPMLINCGFAERVTPLMMIFRIVEQDWSEARAVEEASRSGLKSDSLKKFAKEYLKGLAIKS